MLYNDVMDFPSFLTSSKQAMLNTTPFLKPNALSKNIDNGCSVKAIGCLHENFPKILEIIGSMLAGK